MLGALSACEPASSAAARDAGDDAVLDALEVDGSPLGAPPGMPDLQFVGAEMNEIFVTRDPFSADDCEVKEGCVAEPGERMLLRFDTVTANRGTADLKIGVPPDAGQSDATFEWSECHKHHHFTSYTRYELVSSTGAVITARKQSFCVQDAEPVRFGARSNEYTCLNQGLSRGWADVYSRYTACQWIDVTDVPSGAYTLRIIVNPLHTLPESDYDNNVFSIDVQL